MPLGKYNFQYISILSSQHSRIETFLFLISCHLSLFEAKMYERNSCPQSALKILCDAYAKYYIKASIILHHCRYNQNAYTNYVL